MGTQKDLHVSTLSYISALQCMPPLKKREPLRTHPSQEECPEVKDKVGAGMSFSHAPTWLEG